MPLAVASILAITISLLSLSYRKNLNQLDSKNADFVGRTFALFTVLRKSQKVYSAKGSEFYEPLQVVTTKEVKRSSAKVCARKMYSNRHLSYSLKEPGLSNILYILYTGGVRLGGACQSTLKSKSFGQSNLRRNCCPRVYLSESFKLTANGN